MANKTLDLSKSVYDLVQQHPEVADIMASLGFYEITKKAMLHSVGRMMTIPKGSEVKGIPMEKIVSAFRERGFEPVGLASEPSTPTASATPASRTEQLKSYLRRLGEGEELESVRADFVAHFSEVDASEIMEAEQSLLRDGTPLEEVQRLCDVHSALFHGSTCGESGQAPEGGNKFVAAMFAGIEGHPLYTFSRENEAIATLIASARKALADGQDAYDDFVRLRDISIHYAKKGDLLYPLLKVKYNVIGPSEVMWTVDDEIRDVMGKLEKEPLRDAHWRLRADAVLQRAEEMIYKEQNILFPICAEHFTEAEWQGIYRDSKDYAPCLGVENLWWNFVPTTDPIAATATAPQDEIRMPGGHLSLPQLTAMLNTIPLEISFVDDQNINRFFNEGPKVFKRPAMAIDREVFSCHPPKIEPMVRSIIESFRSGKANVVPVWMEKGGRSMLVQYMAVRDADGQYLGTMEIVQDMEFAREHFQGK